MGAAEQRIEELKTKIAKVRLDKIDWEEQQKIEANIIKDAAEAYAKDLGINVKTATLALKEILPAPTKKPETIESLTEKVNRMMMAVRTVAPRVQGIEERELKNKRMVEHFEQEIRGFSRITKTLDSRVTLLNEVTTKLLQVNIDQQTKYYRIPKFSYLVKKLLGFLGLKKA